MVVREVFEQHPAGYVQSLEQHAAALERTLNEQFPGSAPDHLHAAHEHFLSFDRSGTSPEGMGQYQWPLAQTPFIADVDIFEGFNSTAQQDTETFIDLLGQANQSLHEPHPRGPSVMTMAKAGLNQYVASSKEPEQIPTASAASFFWTYFSYIHPQYPFLSPNDCSNWYMEWKLAPTNAPIRGWPAYFVKMVFRILCAFLLASADKST